MIKQTLKHRLFKHNFFSRQNIVSKIRVCISKMHLYVLLIQVISNINIKNDKKFEKLLCLHLKQMSSKRNILLLNQTNCQLLVVLLQKIEFIYLAIITYIGMYRIMYQISTYYIPLLVLRTTYIINIDIRMSFVLSDVRTVQQHNIISYIVQFSI